MIQEATYVGPVPELRGRRALVMRHPGNEEVLEAQFHELGLRADDRFYSDHRGYRTHGAAPPAARDERNPSNSIRHAGEVSGLPIDVSHGWHEFPRAHFRIDPVRANFETDRPTVTAFCVKCGVSVRVVRGEAECPKCKFDAVVELTDQHERPLGEDGERR